MKSFIIALSIGIFMIGGCILYMVHVENISERLSEINESMIHYIEAEDYENAAKAHDEVSKLLEDNLIMLAATGNHAELDQMQIYLSQISEYIAAEHKGDALAHCKSLMVMFQHLPKNYRLKAENIL